jgi:signal transduction histidine kinase
LILLDIRMPGLDGFEVCARLQAEPATRLIPVIFLSGNLDAEDKVRAFQAGGVDYITKPYHFEEVAARVRTHLELVGARRGLQAQNQTLQASLGETETLNRQLIGMNERLRQSEALKGRFLATMRNEINNPLNAILALGRELEAGAIAPERDRLVGSLIAREASGLDFQIRNIFCAAELEAGEASPAITQVDAASVLRDVIDSLGYLAREKRITFSLELPDRSFATDGGMLHAIAANLVANAIKFSADGGAVEIRLGITEAGLELAVQDHGIGLRPEDQALIFERFRQLESGTARLAQGQGLGLAVALAMVDLLDGSLTVTSALGQGARFLCRLPQGRALDPSGTSSQDGNLFYFGDLEEV